MKRFLSFYHPKLPIFLVYMLQQVEYDPNKLLSWLLRFPNLTRVIYRQNLVPTPKAKALVVFAYVLLLACLTLAVAAGLTSLGLGIVALLLMPFITSILFYFIVLWAWILVEVPRRKNELARAQKIFSKHKGHKIAIAGSYGKTTMKELLLAILSSEKKTAATPGNKNVLISHARWSRTLSGDEEILLIEYGEGAPGDIERFAKLSQPDAGIITGLAPNHLDRYRTLQAVSDDLISLAKFVPAEELYANTDDAGLRDRIPEKAKGYDHQAVLGWKIGSININYDGTRFIMSKGSKKLSLHSRLLGRHQVGPIALVAALAEHLGVSEAAIKKALVKIEPYEHRMQPRHLNGAWIIDDTYNGNIEGIKAGLQLMKDLPAKRKIYVTPGLVDQGAETARVHREIGVAIAKAKPDKVILMQNSVSQFIENGLTAAGYIGSLEYRDDPLNFYSNIDQIVAAGDLALMQNDWTDNYK